VTAASWVVLLLGLACAAALAAALHLAHRSRRQLAALSARLAALEVGWAAGGAAAVVPLAPEEPPEPPRPGTPAPVSPETDTPGGDVLHGLTTHVQGLLARGCSPTEALGDRAILAIFRRLGEPLAPARLADDLYVSLRTLERGLAFALDCTPSQLILAVKMREARRLLDAGGLRVGDVAERVGYADPFHFSRRFKAFWGRSPSELKAAPESVPRPARRG